MSHSSGRPQALDVEGGKAYEEPATSPVNNDTILPTYRNGETARQPRSPSDSVSDDQKHDAKEAREVDLDATEPPHEERQAEKSAFTKKLDQYAHVRRPIIHAFMVAFCLGESSASPFCLCLCRYEMSAKKLRHFLQFRTAQHGSGAH